LRLACSPGRCGLGIQTARDARRRQVARDAGMQDATVVGMATYLYDVMHGVVVAATRTERPAASYRQISCVR